MSGNPVRPGFVARGADPRTATAGHRPRLLVFGGSQGAHAINMAVLEALPRLVALDPVPSITHQAGDRDLEAVREGYRRAGVDARIEPFLHDMDREMHEADLVVCRAGATTLAELMAMGKPALLIPLPTATDDHQRKNAEALARAGAAAVLEQRDLTGDTLAARIQALLQDPSGAGRWRRQRSAPGGPTPPASSSIACSRSSRRAGEGPVAMLGRTRHVHFVGIGGIGMSGIAELLVNLGYVVSGSDAKAPASPRGSSRWASPYASATRPATSARPTSWWSRRRFGRTTPRSPRRARRHIPVIPRAEMLAELMRLRYGVAVAGTHGKTTTTSMVALVLERAGLDPTAVIGGRLSAFGSNARLGRGELMVAEADESDGSFLRLSPTIAVITNVDEEHLNHYGDFGRLCQAFVDFANKVPFYGAVVACLDDPRLAELIPSMTRRVVTYGIGRDDVDVRGTQASFDHFRSRCDVVRRGLSGEEETLGELRLLVPGRHNLLNALAAVAVSLELAVPFARVAAALAEFRGAERRFQRLGEAAGVLVVDDYGHHPTEIAAVLAAAKSGEPRRVFLVFQPHRFSRTAALLEAFADVLAQADELVLTDIYAAGEAPIPGLTVDVLADAVRRRGTVPVHVVRPLEAIPDAVATRARPGDLVITLGAGSIGTVGERILAALRGPAGVTGGRS